MHPPPPNTYMRRLGRPPIVVTTRRARWRGFRHNFWRLFQSTPTISSTSETTYVKLVRPSPQPGRNPKRQEELCRRRKQLCATDFEEIFWPTPVTNSLTTTPKSLLSLPATRPNLALLPSASSLSGKSHGSLAKSPSLRIFQTILLLAAAVPDHWTTPDRSSSPTDLDGRRTSPPPPPLPSLEPPTRRHYTRCKWVHRPHVLTASATASRCPVICRDHVLLSYNPDQVRSLTATLILPAIAEPAQTLNPSQS